MKTKRHGRRTRRGLETRTTATSKRRRRRQRSLHLQLKKEVVKPSYDRPRPNLQGQRHHLQAYRTRETNANRTSTNRDCLPSEPRVAGARSQGDHQGLSSENKIPTRAVQAEDRTTTKFTSNLHEKTSQSSCTGYHRQVDAQYDEEVWHRHKHLQGPFCKSSRCGGVQKKRDVP